mgnify:CR=1 FL=1
MNRQIWVIILIASLTVMMLFLNKKVNLIRLFIKQLEVFKNAHTGKRSIWDIICFFVFPIAISGLIVFGLSFRVTAQLAETLTTVFSLVFTILFGFAAVIVEKRESDTEKKKRVISETFVSIITSTSLSLFSAFISILLTVIAKDPYVSILSVILFAVSLHIIMLLLMITKRTFVIYCEDKQGN